MALRRRGIIAEKWGKSKLSERSAYQQHFLDLFRMPGQPTPAEADMGTSIAVTLNGLRLFRAKERASEGVGGRGD